jgi:hypothetical protein
MPKVKHSLWNWLTGVDINDLNVKQQFVSGLVLANVITNEHVWDIVWPNNSLGSQNTANIVEDIRSRWRLAGGRWCWCSAGGIGRRYWG